MTYSKEFLKHLDQYPHKALYIKIISLNKEGLPQGQIEGRCTGGSINVDGDSAVRRSCSLTMIAFEGESIVETDWAFKNKFKLEVGLKNEIDTQYPNIIWFKQGIYVINQFSQSQNSNGQIQISISGQDKMCLLNGTLGGAFPHEIDFGTEQYVDANNNIHIEKIPLYKIIKTAIQVYAQESLQNIIINDLDEHGWELWEYRGDNPMYLIYKISEDLNTYGQVINMTFNGDTEIIKLEDGEEEKVQISNSDKINYRSMNTLDSDYNDYATKFKFTDDCTCNVIKISNGETVGYHQIDLVYNDDLILKAGEPLTSLLDKIKNMLGDFEYFYDLDGKFVFQKKNTYLQELFSPINGDIIEPTITVSPYSYRFENKNLFTNISTQPKIDNIKNDFVVWGTRKGVSGSNLPIHARYAIDKKPIKYQSVCPRTFYKYNEQIYSKSQYTEILAKILEYGDTDIWAALSKEKQAELLILYDYNKDGKIDENDSNKVKNNFILLEDKEDICPEYSSEKYDWRELIYQMAWDYYQGNEDPDFLYKVAEANPWAIDGKTGYEQYYSDIQGFWRQLYNPYPTEEDKKQFGEFYTLEDYDKPNTRISEDDIYWNTKIHLDPYALNFWFDFLDLGEGAELSKYSVKNIGQRIKTVEKENGIKSIYNQKTPEVQFIVMPIDSFENNFNTSYQPIWIQDNMKNLFIRSAQGLSCIEKVNELIFTHTCCNETLSLTAIPIYYLQPNTRISILDEDYIINKITYNLNYNGTMSLNVTKLIKEFY